MSKSQVINASKIIKRILLHLVDPFMDQLVSFLQLISAAVQTTTKRQSDICTSLLLWLVSNDRFILAVISVIGQQLDTFAAVNIFYFLYIFCKELRFKTFAFEEKYFYWQLWHTKAVWPDLVKFLGFGKILQVCGNFWGCI